MRLQSIRLYTAVLACVLFMLASCSTTVAYRSPGKKKGYGPPPHAPAHGRRHKLPKGVQIVYDSPSGVYVVVGYERHYYLDGLYYRFCNGQWQVSVAIESGWKTAPEQSLPPGLRGKYTSRHTSKSHKGRGLALGNQK